MAEAGAAAEVHGGPPVAEVAGSDLLASMLSGEFLDFELGDLGHSDDEGLPTGKALQKQWADMGQALPMDEWRKKMKDVLDRKPKLRSVGRLLVSSILSLKTPLGSFAREFANPEGLPQGAEPASGSGGPAQHGDLLPIHPSLVEDGLEGISTHNLPWVQAVVMCLDFLYCAGWSKAVCVPMQGTLGTNQKKALARIGGQIDRLLEHEVRMPSTEEAVTKLGSKKFDYNGQPVDHMQDLVAERVLAAWPRPGSAAVVNLQECVPHELKEALNNPRDYLLPETELPERHRGSRVRASETEWFKIVKAGYDRGMMVAVREEDIPQDRRGHLITNGAGGVAKVKMDGGTRVEAQRFISILCPTNDAMRLLPGAQDTLPYIGQLTGVLAEKDSYLVLDSEDLQSAFNLFRLPEQWAPFFSFSQKVRGDALGGSSHTMLRPGLRVVPMGWTSAVTLVQAAIRHIAYTIAKIPPHGNVTMNAALPESETKTVLYLDNFDEIRHLKKEIAADQVGAPSANHKKFIEACECLGLPRNQGKQLCGALNGALQGGEILGEARVLRHAYDKTIELISLGLGLLTQATLPEFFLRHWTGKAAFAAAFRRPLYSILQEVYGALEFSREGAHLTLPLPAVDEVLLFTALVGLAETDLSSEISAEISCTDASPTGGGSSVATVFKDKTLILPDPVEDVNLCGCCGKELQEVAHRTYPCSRRCGLRMCTLKCSRSHEDGCSRKWWHTPTFGERFSGENYPLSKAVGLKGISTQSPLDYDVPDDRWDFRTDAGKNRLDEEELAGDLMWSHWSPTRVTFSKKRGQGFWNRWNRWEENEPRLRSGERPEGIQRLSKSDLVQVRQANAIAKRAARGLVEAKRRGRRRNDDDIEERDTEYPWSFCLVMAEGIHDELTSLYSAPFGAKPMNLENLMRHQLRGATRGLQQETAVAWAVSQCTKFLETMESGQEAEHFKWLLRHSHHTGCDVRLTDRGGELYGHRPGPYPAFRWLWRDVLSYKWKEEQHINILELTAFLTELRRRARNENELGKRFFNVVDSLVCFYVLGKGRSSSKRLNRVSRRIAAVSLGGGLIPLTLWTISKWNYSDAASYERAVSAFFLYLRALRGRLPRSMLELDEELAEYINHLYQEGDPLSLAGWTVSGLKRFHPRCRPHLLTAQVFLRNWQRVHLPRRTNPMSWLGAKAMASAACQANRPDLALVILLGFAFFLRTMELLAMQVSHVRLFPENGTIIVAILNSKTSRGLQQSLSLHEPALVKVIAFLLSRARPSRLLYEPSVAVFRREFASLVTFVGLDPALFLPYSLRRGGATQFYQRTQSLGRTMVQGRWKDAQTARIYIDDARATLIQFLLPPPAAALQHRLSSFWRWTPPTGERPMGQTSALLQFSPLRQWPRANLDAFQPLRKMGFAS
ncbi:unnamed protein product [Symbiodinium sp. CCMP2592]|nr:unnamed protein product [Symbiodinium sp. CCMP2592]